ncbi:MOSC domain-containing protein [Streptomyces sp. NPDC058045]|uniref:MOSC domain-containing protein n=1 Tax=Streptomyces sp. NPDC058045 TaxID=3346311 RepID=UPI0036EA36E7
MPTASATLTALHVYPLKAARALAPSTAAVEPWGLAGDRRWMLIDSSGRAVTQRQQPLLARVLADLAPGGGLRLEAPGLAPLDVAVPVPGSPVAVAEIFGATVETVTADPAAAEWFSGLLDVPVRLVHLDEPGVRRPVDPGYGRPGDTVSFADGYPLLLTTTASLAALNTLIADGGHPEEGPLPMNRFRPSAVVDGVAAWAEDDWTRISIGEVRFRVVKMCGRCVVTTTDQETAERGREPLRTLARARRFGDQLVFGQNLIPETTGTLRLGDPVRILD